MEELSTKISHDSAVVLTGFSFSLSSISMIVMNKACTNWFPHASLLLILQNLATILILLFTGDYPRPLEARVAFEWLPCSLLFCVNLLSSLKSLVFISVPTFTVLRNVHPILSVGVDYMVRGEKTSFVRVPFLLQILIGAVLYCFHDLEFELHGYVWAFIHVASMTLYSVIVKLKCESMGLSSRAMSLYNNVLSIPGAIVVVEQMIDSRL